MCHLPFLQRGVSIISAEEGIFFISFSHLNSGQFSASQTLSASQTHLVTVLQLPESKIKRRIKRKVRQEQMPGKRKVPGKAVQCSSQDFISNVVDPQGLEPWTDRL